MNRNNKIRIHDYGMSDKATKRINPNSYTVKTLNKNVADKYLKRDERKLYTSDSIGVITVDTESDEFITLIVLNNNQDVYIYTNDDYILTDSDVSKIWKLVSGLINKQLKLENNIIHSIKDKFFNKVKKLIVKENTSMFDLGYNIVCESVSENIDNLYE